MMTKKELLERLDFYEGSLKGSETALRRYKREERSQFFLAARQSTVDHWESKVAEFQAKLNALNNPDEIDEIAELRERVHQLELEVFK